MIGLYLRDEIPAGLTPDETVAAIREQDGLVYLPHPFDTLRRGSIRPEAREAVARQADILEVRNGRALLPRFDGRAAALAAALGKAGAAGSDAHYAAEVGRVWVEVAAPPTPETLMELLRAGRVGGRRLPGDGMGLGLPHPKRVAEAMGPDRRGSLAHLPAGLRPPVSPSSLAGDSGMEDNG